jgi:hypothetical protein
MPSYRALVREIYPDAILCRDTMTTLISDYYRVRPYGILSGVKEHKRYLAHGIKVDFLSWKNGIPIIPDIHGTWTSTPRAAWKSAYLSIQQELLDRLEE